MFLHNKFFVLGAARSGISAARLLKQHGADVFVSELKLISPDIRAILQNENIAYEENGHDIKNLCANFNAVVVSPGIPLSHECLVQAKAHGLLILSEIELALTFINPQTKLIGITGTNGKSTTTHYLAHLLNAHGFSAAACGNIGTPFSEVLLLKNDYDVLSIELSSYQLELGLSKKFHGTILLNLQNDHLARHATFENYLRAKWNLILATREDGICIIDDSVLHMAQKFQFEIPNCKIENTFNNTFKINEPCLIGKHNETNIYSASLAAIHIGVSYETVAREWEKETSHYKSLAHRLERIHLDPAVKPRDDNRGERDDNRRKWDDNRGKWDDNRGEQDDRRIQDRIFINDSKATNVESTLVALKALKQPVHLLVGGEPKGDSYLPISDFFGKNVIRVYPFGNAGHRIYEELKKFDIFLENPSHGMIDASQKALQNSKAGDTILLSPACSSFDEFNHFEHRGDVFKAWVKGLSSHDITGR